MTDDLDLRAIHQHHDPDPRFVAELEDRIEAVLAASGVLQDATATAASDAIDLELTPPLAAPNQLRNRRLARFAVAIVAAAACVAVLVVLADRDADPEPTNPVGPPRVIVPQPNGWIAFGQGDVIGPEGVVTASITDTDIYLVREGASPRRVAGSDGDMADQICPSFSSDGAWLAYGQATIKPVDQFESTYKDDAAITIAKVSPEGTTTVVNTIAVQDAAAPPCPNWSSSGRWLAFSLEPRVWLVDTQTGEARKLPGYDVTDIEWRPGTDELAIAHGGIIDIYTPATDNTRSLSVHNAFDISWSPGGTTVAFTEVTSESGGETGADRVLNLWLADADGSNERILADGYRAIHGIGPVWSPAGDRLAYQRACTTTPEAQYDQKHPGEFPEDRPFNTTCYEENEVVLLTIDGDAVAPAGTEVVIPPPMTYRDDQPVWWYPYSVTWSPDASTLLYHAWGDDGDVRPGHLPNGIVALPLATKAPIVLVQEDADASDTRRDEFVWTPIQTWGVQTPK